MFVCRFPGNKCLPCGVAATTDPEKWASVYCTAGWVEGNQIKVTHSYEVLQFCEIQVFGQEFGKLYPLPPRCDEKPSLLVELTEYRQSTLFNRLKKPSHYYIFLFPARQTSSLRTKVFQNICLLTMLLYFQSFQKISRYYYFLESPSMTSFEFV